MIKLTKDEVVLGIKLPLSSDDHVYKDFEIVNFETHQSIKDAYPDKTKEDLELLLIMEPKWRTGLKYNKYEKIYKGDNIHDFDLKKVGMTKVARRFNFTINIIDITNDNWMYVNTGKPPYHSNYIINEDGVVFSIGSLKQISPCKDKQGYWKISLSIQGKAQKHYLHKLVYRSFNGFHNERITFIDGNKDNYKLSNLKVMRMSQYDIAEETYEI